MTVQPSELRLASLKIRLVSMIYEGLLLTALLFIATALFIAVFGDSREEPMRTGLRIFLVLVAGGYFVWSWTGGRQTLPMRTWHMRVVAVDGSPPSPRVAAMRYLVAALTLPVAGLAVVWALFDPKRLFLHDRIARTRIVLDAEVSRPA